MSNSQHYPFVLFNLDDVLIRGLPLAFATFAVIDPLPSVREELDLSLDCVEVGRYDSQCPSSTFLRSFRYHRRTPRT